MALIRGCFASRGPRVRVPSSPQAQVRATTREGVAANGALPPGRLARTALDHTLTCRFTWRSVPEARSRRAQDPAGGGAGGGPAAAGDAELGQDVGAAPAVV